MTVTEEELRQRLKEALQYKPLCLHAQQLAFDFAKLLDERTEERDQLLSRVTNSTEEKVIQLTPKIMELERKRVKEATILQVLRHLRAFELNADIYKDIERILNTP